MFNILFFKQNNYISFLLKNLFGPHLHITKHLVGDIAENIHSFDKNWATN